MGDVIPYVVTSTIPDMSGYEKYYFVVNDTMSKGLTFNNDINIVIDVDGDGTRIIELKQGDILAPDDVDSMGLVEGDYTVEITENSDGSTGIEIVFKDFIKYRGEAEIDESGEVPVVTYPKSLAGAEIVITYSATLNENAKIGVEGNPNEVELKYSNNPNKKDDGDPKNPDKPTPESPVGETGKKETRTYVTGIELTKVNDNGKNLTGAIFQIEGTRLKKVLVSSVEFVEDSEGEYWLLKDGTYTKKEPTEDTTDAEGNVVPGTKNLYSEAGKKYKRVVTNTTQEEKEDVKISAEVDASGVLRFNGLAAGVYTITELKAPNGYNMLKNPVTVKIECGTPETLETEVKEDSDSTANNCKWNAIYTLDALTEAQRKTMEEKTITDLTESAEKPLGDKVTLTKLDYSETLDLFPQNIVNVSGALLPSTGGIGTTIFYVVGGILVLAAVILLVTKKRMSKEN